MQKLAAALPAFDRPAIQQLTAGSFRGACDLYDMGAPALHAMMQAMRAAPGVIGVRHNEQVAGSRPDGNCWLPGLKPGDLAENELDLLMFYR